MVDSRIPAAKRIEAAAPDEPELRAPLFGALMERVRAGDRRVILDLGPAQAATVRIFNSFRCRLDIADLPANLIALNAGDDPGDLRDSAEAALPGIRGEPVHVVLCWDLLNYLQRPALAAIMERLAARLQSNALLHMLIVYSGRRMPERPGLYRPCTEPGREDRLIYRAETGVECDAPRYTPDDLAHCMRGYRVERAVLLNNGMQEFLFRR